jgi:hypothetical protein
MNATRWFGGVGRLLPILIIVAATVLAPTRARAGRQDTETYANNGAFYSVEYDPEQWRWKDRSFDVVFFSEDAGFVWFDYDYEGRFEGDVDACVDALDHEYTDVIDEDDLDRPEAPEGGASILARGIENGPNSTIPEVLQYRLCLPVLPDDSSTLLVVDWSIAEDDYEDAWPIVDDLLSTLYVPSLSA